MRPSTPQSGWLQFRIRYLDRSVALIGGIILLPFVLGAAIAIRLNDRGPAFIKVRRVGAHFDEFDMWKLRSMRADNPTGTASGPSLTARDDERITPIGKRIRSMHFDEVPQLLNVLRGEMLLLGARPEAPDYVDATVEDWQFVLQVPPGMAGPTQLVVSNWERTIIADTPDDGSYERDVLPTKLAIDRWYLETCSLSRDIEVGWALLKRFMPGSRGTRMKRRIYRELDDKVAIVRAWDIDQVRASRLKASVSEDLNC